MANLSIKVSIANRVYPLTVKPEEEEGVRKAARLIEKVLKSAVANARERGGRDNLDALTVSEIQVGPGPTLKRWLPRARGRATPIRKRTSHIRIILRDTPQSSAQRRP